MAQIVLSTSGSNFSRKQVFDLAAFFGHKAEGDFDADPTFHGSTLWNVEVADKAGNRQLVIPSDLGAGIDKAIDNASAVTISYVTRAPYKGPVSLTWDKQSPHRVRVSFPDTYAHVRAAIAERAQTARLQVS